MEWCPMSRTPSTRPVLGGPIQRTQALRSGQAIVTLAILHTAASFMPYDAWQQLLALGVWNAGFGNWYVAAVFWSFLVGPLLGCIGWMLVRYGREKTPFSRGVGLLLFGTSLFGAIVWPVGGFWLVAAVALYMTIRGA